MSRAPWLRVNPAIRSFVLGEVERQYHPIGTQEYAERVEWMTDAWMWAQLQATTRDRPTIQDILHLASVIEPRANRDGFRTVRVRVGDHLGTEPELVPRAVGMLWDAIDLVVPKQGRAPRNQESHDITLTADDFYLEFERIHPFRDGNGRTGKILHNWLLGTLDDPVLVADYFGGGNP